ncbi:MAG: XRE family transcriptional regulator [Bacteroidales bacterium]
MKLSKTEYQLSVITTVKNLRVAHNESQMQIANILGVSNGQVGNIESVKYPHKYTLKQLYIISQHFNTPIHRLFVSDNDEVSCDDIVKMIIEYDK